MVYTGRTVHVVPAEDGGWTVVDLQRRGWSFRSKADALDYARRIAFANQPSQVVLFTATGGMETVAHYQLPEYQYPQATAQGGNGSLFDATVKALVIGGLVAAGVAVLGELVDTVERDLKRESGRSRARQRRRRQMQEA
ncbi:hypothetical protein SBA6_230031 [Candidatus Sulfopaludibacter sp. SbA6]|nr:hypothetical protein SBA6_230031 [Candidatus Sulfopaludibacter sp. SbA6]